MNFLEGINWAHVHLIFNHLPVIGIPVVLFFLVAGILLENGPMRQISLIVLIFLSISAIGIF